jgi:hypothetical protein
MQPRRPTALNIRGASVPPSHDRLWVPDGQTAVVCVPYDGLYFLDCCGLNRKIGPTSDRALQHWLLRRGAAIQVDGRGPTQRT